MSCASPGRLHSLPPLNVGLPLPGSWQSESMHPLGAEGTDEESSVVQARQGSTEKDRPALAASEWCSQGTYHCEEASPDSHSIEDLTAEHRRAYTDQWRLDDLRRLQCSAAQPSKEHSPRRLATAAFTHEDLQGEFTRLTELLRAELWEMAGNVRKGVKEDLMLLCEDWQRRVAHGSQLRKPFQTFSAPPSRQETPGSDNQQTDAFNGTVDRPRIKRFSRSASVESMAARTPSNARCNQYSSVTPSPSVGDAVADAVAVTSEDQQLKAEFRPITSTPSGHISTYKRRVSDLSAAPAALARSRSAELSSRLLRVVNHPLFDYFVAALIVLNGVLVGVQTDYMAKALEETTPMPFEVLEIIFCIVFTSEVALRLWAFRCGFFTRGGMGWNIFDLVIVTLQLVELFLSAVSDGLGFSFNLLRILRLIRIIRLARALRLIGELRTIVSSIAGSLKPLFWTGMLLLMVIYVLGVYITQVVLNKRMTLQTSGMAIPEALNVYWGSLLPSIFSLFESIAGGVDWDQVVRPLIHHISPEMALLFSLYIMFTCFAMLNVVTGVFIESVMKNAREENEQRTRNQISSLFATVDFDHNGEISWQAFEKHLDRKEMRHFFKTIDVDISNARNLFELLDVDEKGTLHFEEFMDGCLRIWSPSSGLDLRMIRRDVSKLNSLLRHVLSSSAQS